LLQILLIYNNSHIHPPGAPSVLISGVTSLYRPSNQYLSDKFYINNITHNNTNLKAYGMINNRNIQNVITFPQNIINFKSNNNLYYNKIIIIIYITTGKIILIIIADKKLGINKNIFIRLINRNYN
jgi:hypothetical protein